MTKWSERGLSSDWAVNEQGEQSEQRVRSAWAEQQGLTNTTWRESSFLYSKPRATLFYLNKPYGSYLVHHVLYQSSFGADSILWLQPSD